MDDLKRKIQILRAYLKSISEDESMDSIYTELQSTTESSGEMELESLTEPPNERGLETLDAIYNHNDGDIDEEDLYSLEAIIHKEGRPVIDIIHDTYHTPQNGKWAGILGGDVKARINDVIPSVGRVEISNAAIPYVGTGFVVGEGILMTNRHVALQFAGGIGQRDLIFDQSFYPGVDFKREIVPPQGDPEILSIERVLMIHPHFDMALLQVDGLGVSNRNPLGLLATPPEEILNNNIVVIGYPAKDRRNDIMLQMKLFNHVFEVKRMAPGKLRDRVNYETSKQTINSVAHDSSTLAGNSGSCVIDTDTGMVVGLHFAGEYLKTNYAVSMNDLARDSRVVDTGINFIGDAQPSDVAYGIIWTETENRIDTPLPYSEEGLFSKKIDVTPYLSKMSIESLFSESFDWEAALSSALGSHASYMSGAPLQKLVVEDWGFDSCRLIEKNNSECFIAQNNDRALIAFRGTEMNLSDWLNNLKVLSTSSKYGSVHSGFLAAFKAVDSQLRAEILTKKIKTIVLTGHSLGGAIAMIAAVEWSDWLDENGISIEHIYTFGQPAAGDKKFANNFNERRGEHCHRFVNNNDIVARLPPLHTHCDKLMHFDSNGALVKDFEEGFNEFNDSSDTMLSQKELDRFKESNLKNLEGVEEGVLPSIRDHSISHYINIINKVSI